MSASETVRVHVPEAREGSLLAGKYLIEETIGSGGMGVVMAARHLDLDERVAIKFLLPDVAHDNEAVSRFAREAWAASRIKSEYVARVSDVGRLESGVPYIVMEHLDGMDLAQMLRSRGPLPIEQSVEFVLQACEAIAEAHALGIVHRDLKPSNLFCVRRSDGLLAIKVLDFGISKVTRPLGKPVDISITTTSATVGSPLYMAPEQMSSAKIVDERVDIWALGVILHQLMTAFPPFYAETLPELAVQIATEPPTLLRSRRPDAPRALERIVLRCLEKDRTRRYPHVAELALALVEFGPARASTHAERAERVLRAASRYGAPRSEPLPSASSFRSRGQSSSYARYRRLYLPLGATLVSLGAGAVFWTQYLESEPPPARPASLVRPAAPVTPSIAAPQPAAPSDQRPGVSPAAATEPSGLEQRSQAAAPVPAVPVASPEPVRPATRAEALPARPRPPRPTRPATSSAPAPADPPSAPPPTDSDDLGGRI